MKAKLDSINLVSEIPGEVRDFFVKILDFEEDTERSHPPGFYLLRGGKGCNLLIQQSGNSAAGGGVTGFELGVEVASIDIFLDKAGKAGCKTASPLQQMGWGKGLAIADPEGRVINVYEFVARR